jgi:arylformamidase
MLKNNIVLLSHTYSSSTPSYGNRDLFKSTVNSSICSGETANSSCWTFTTNHLGTHIDVPYHFSETGIKLTDIPPTDWIFNIVEIIEIHCDKAKLIDITDLEAISIDPNIELLLIRTNYENYRRTDKYWNDNPGISPEVADYLRSKFSKLRSIGFDFISLTSWKHRLLGKTSHKTFLSPENNAKPILAIEDMSLKNLKGKIDWVIVSPILVENENGAPVTIFANII